MVDTKKRKGTITEEDMALVLQRYSAKTILALLQEISQVKFDDTKIDWSELAKKKSIGITCPRECQMLWRHLAYCHPLLEKPEEGAEPLDDDSDLEFAVEPSPTVSGEASTEAFAYVKVLMSSGLNNDSSPADHPPVEAPLTINIPDVQFPLRKEEMLIPSQNIRVPVFVQKHALPAVLAVENLDGNGTSCPNQPGRKKRRGWNKGDEKKLMAAIEKRGVGNWQDLEKEDFRVPRTAYEIQQRWIHMKAKNTGSAVNFKKTNITEDQLLMRQALSRALDMPSNRSSSAQSSGGITTSSISSSIFSTTGGITTSSISSSIFSTTIPETASFNLQKLPNQSQQTLSQAIPQKIGSQLLNKPRTAQVRAPITMASRAGSHTMIQKAAIAAGGRIAPAETAASLFKAAQSKNVVHIRPGGTVSVSTAAPTKPSPSMPSVGPHSSVTAQPLLSVPANSGMVSSVSGTACQIAKCSIAKPAIQPLSTPTVVQQPCKQPLEELKSTVSIFSSKLGNADGSACSLPKGGSAVLKIASTANQGQMSVVDLETDEMCNSADAADKGNSPMRETQQASEVSGGTLKNSCVLSGRTKAFQTKTFEMKQISLHSKNQDTDSQTENKKSKPVTTTSVDGFCSLDGDAKDKAVASLDKKPIESCSLASINETLKENLTKANPTSCLSTSAEVGTSTLTVVDDDKSTENGGLHSRNLTEESVAPAFTANDSQHENDMVCTASTNLETASRVVQSQSG